MLIFLHYSQFQFFFNDNDSLNDYIESNSLFAKPT